MPPTVSIPPQPVEIVLEVLKQPLESMGTPGYQDLHSKCVPNGVSQGGNSKSSSTLQGKAETRFVKNSVSGSRQNTSGATEGSLTEYTSASVMELDKHGPPSVLTPKSAGAGLMRGRASRAEDLKIDGFPRSLLKPRGMGTKSRSGARSSMLSFSSLLEGAINASGVQPRTSVHKIAESGTRAELSLRGDTVGGRVPPVSYYSLLQAQLGDDPVEVRAAPSCKTAGTLHLNVEAHSPPIKFQLRSAEVEGGFLALLNQTTRSLAPVAQWSSSPQADTGGHFSDKLLQAVAQDASGSADIVSERDGSVALRATAGPTSAALARCEGDVPRVKAAVERRISNLTDSMCSDEDASGTPHPEDRGGPLAVNESRSADILSDRLTFDFCDTATAPTSPVLTRRGEVVLRADAVVSDAASIEDEMADAQLFEELERGLAIQDSTFAENASNMSVVNSPEAAAALTSAVPTRIQQSVPREEVVVERSTVAVADSVSSNGKALDVELSEEPSGPLGVDESWFACNVSKRVVTDSSNAVPEVPVLTRLEEADLPTGIERASCAVAEMVSDEENVSDVQLPDEVPQALVLDESRFAEFVPERDPIDSLGSATVLASPELVRREEGVSRVEVVVTGSMGMDEEMSDLFVWDELSQALALDGLRNRGIVIGEDPAKLPGAAAESEPLLDTRTREDVPLSEALVEMELGLCGDAVGHSEQSKDHLLSFNRSDEELSDGRIQSPSQRLETEKRCADGCDDLIDGGTALASSFGAGLKQMGDADLKEMEDVDRDVVGLREETSCEVQRNVVLDCICEANETCPCGCRADIVSARTVGRPHYAVPERIENQKKERKDEVCDAQMPSPTEKVLVTSKADIESLKFVLQKELDISRSEPADSVHPKVLERAEQNVPRAVAVVERRSSLVSDSTYALEEALDCRLPEEDDGALPVDELKPAGILSERFAMDSREVTPVRASHVPTRIEKDVSLAKVLVDPVSVLVADSVSTDEQMLDVQLLEELTGALEGSVSLCAEGISEPVDEGAIVSSSWHAGPKHIEVRNGIIGLDQKDSNCPIEMRENLMVQNAGAMAEHLIGSDCGSDQEKNCGGSVGMTSTTASPHANGNLLVAKPTHTDGSDQVVILAEEKVGEVRMLECLEDSNEVVSPLEGEHHKFYDFAGVASGVKRAILSYSESRAGFVASETGYESELVSPPDLVVIEQDVRNEEEGVPEGHIEEIVNVATDSGIPADQALSADPDAISEGLRQVILRNSDAAVSESLESVQVSGAEIGVAQEAGKQVQSPLGTKAKDGHCQHVDDFEDWHTDDLTVQRTRHLDELEDNGDQPYVSPLNVTVDDQLVRPLKKRGRPRAYYHDKAPHEAGRPHPHPSGSKRRSQLQNTSNRSRRNRHINPDQPVLVLVEGRDEDFEDADCGPFCRWLTHQDKGYAAPTVRKRVRKHDQEMVKSRIATPSFRVVPDYEDTQQNVEKRRKVVMEQHRGTCEMQTLMSSRTVRDYDMDDEDGRWLHAWNKRLARGVLKQPISEDKFEEIIEYFEKMHAQMEVAPAEDFQGVPVCQQSSAHSVPGSSLPSTSPSGLGCLGISPAGAGVPVPENAAASNPSRIRSRHPPWTGGLKDVPISGKKVLASSAIRVKIVGGESGSPSSTVIFRTLTSENERNICKSVIDTVTEKTSEGSLLKSFRAPTQQNPSDGCCICNGGEDDDDNPVYTCKQCLIHVHQSCYGIREKFCDAPGHVVGPSSWCCRKCEAVAVGRAQPKVSCALCRKRGGALKPTVAPRKWAHVACALYTKEAFFVDPDAMEPIDGIAAVAARAQDRQGRQDRCGLCGVKRGVCSICSVKDCRAPFHISCGVSHGASFELRQSKQKVVSVRSLCPRHAHMTPTSAPSTGLNEGHLLSSTMSGATVSATASSSISTASSIDYREEWRSQQNTSCMDGSFVEPARQATNAATYVGNLTDNVTSMTGKGFEDTGRGRPNGLRFTLKRRRAESCTQVSKDGVSSDLQKKSGNGREVIGDKIKSPGCISTWHVVELGQKLKKSKSKLGRLAQNEDPESSPTLVQQGRIGSEDPEAEKIKEVMPVVGEASGDASGNGRDIMFFNGFSEDRFAKEVKELTIFEQAMKSDVAPVHIMREAFVYWRAKRAEHKGSLLCELKHKQWSKSHGIFNVPGDVGNLATGKMASPMRVPLAQQLSSESTEKMLEKAKELRVQLDRVRSMAQMVIRREKLKYNHQLVLMTIASAELNRIESISEERRCVWCPSTKTLLKCGTCPRSFCFNCFKNRKGFGVKGWMAAMKHPEYSCKYCRELLCKVADLSNNLEPGPKDIANAGLVSNQVIPSEPTDGMFITSLLTSDSTGGGRRQGIGKGRGKRWGFQGFDYPDSALFRRAEGGVVASANKTVDVNEVRSKGLGIGRGKGNRWTVSDNARPGPARRGSGNGANNQGKTSHLESGLSTLLSITNGQMEHSSFETTLRRLKILRHSNTSTNQALMISADIPSEGIAEESADMRASGPVINELEALKQDAINDGNVSVPVSPGPGPAMLVFKKNRRLILGPSSETPLSAYDFADYAPSSPVRMENGS